MSTLTLIFVFKIYFIFVFERVAAKGGEKERILSCLLVHLLNDCYSWSWASLQPGAWDFFQLSRVGADANHVALPLLLSQAVCREPHWE